MPRGHYLTEAVKDAILGATRGGGERGRDQSARRHRSKVNASLRPFVATGIRARTFFALGVDGAAQSRRC